MNINVIENFWTYIILAGIFTVLVMIKDIRFGFFVLTVFIWSYMTFLLGIKKNNEINLKFTALYVLVYYLISMLTFLSIVYIFSNTFIIKFFMFFMAIAVVSVAISCFIIWLISNLHIPWGERSVWGPHLVYPPALIVKVQSGKRLTWAKQHLKCKYNNLEKGMEILIVFLTISIVLIGGIFYYLDPAGSYTQINHIFLITVVALFIPEILLSLPYTIAVLLSENVDFDSRNIKLAQQVPKIVFFTLYLSLILWTLGVKGQPLGDFEVGIVFTVSPILIISTILFIVVIFLVPYLLGSKKSKKWNEQLIYMRKAWVYRILDTLEFKSTTDTRDELEKIKDEINKEIKSFKDKYFILDYQNNPCLNPKKDEKKNPEHRFKYPQFLHNIKNYFKKTGALNLETEQNKFLENLINYIKDTESLDPRFNHLKFLNNLKRELDQIIQQTTISNEDYAHYYRKRNDELEVALGNIKEVKTLVWAGLVFILVPILSQILNQFGTLIFKFFQYL